MSGTSVIPGPGPADLDLGDLTVTSMRDTVALPEGGASNGARHCSCSSSSCAQPQLPVPLWVPVTPSRPPRDP
ncbi:thiazolylpeptide-type bacteriocin [Streptomyces sp. NPDC000348]|uniref:thiazolylpeptide-type bacteriocin n=1 Tax=Streptomyces sp. NPDC000348 TaxID=3364538 RepID=UPI0036CCAE60